MSLPVPSRNSLLRLQRDTDSFCETRRWMRLVEAAKPSGWLCALYSEHYGELRAASGTAHICCWGPSPAWTVHGLELPNYTIPISLVGRKTT